MITLTCRQARQFILLKHGLLGGYRFIGKAGALEFIRQVGCIQYDPIDICGRNAELVLQSRIKGFTKAMLAGLLYTDRALVDYPDKNLSIIPVEDWPYFERYRQAGRRHATKYPGMHILTEQARIHIEKNGAVCSDDLKLEGDMHWRSAIHWSAGSNLSRSVLEQMYSTGELVVHHKKGTRKYYDLANRYISTELLEAAEPLPDEFEHQKWRVLRRIGAVGFLWNRPSDAWLNIWGLKSSARSMIFDCLLEEGKIFEISVEGIRDAFFCRCEDMPLIKSVQQGLAHKFRCELIAPLDNFIWDRKLIKALFGFDYTWEIYVPADKRKYGYYVLPLLYGESFIGRAEAIAERKSRTLIVKNIWYEDGVKQTKKLRATLSGCFKRFAGFNGCGNVQCFMTDDC
jgi:Uncharacterized protein conserved in bacteria